MTTTTEQPLPQLSDEAITGSLSGRFGALLVLGCTAAVILWSAHAGYWAFSDAWVAPLHLSPDSDAVLYVRQQLTRETAERARLEAEVSRLDGQLGALSTALERLGKLRSSSSSAMQWQASVHAGEAGTFQSVLDTLQQQRAQLEGLHRAQAEVTGRAQQDLQSGLIERHEYTKHEQALRSAAAALADNQRLIDETLQRKRVASVSSSAYRAKLKAGNVISAKGSQGELPQAMQFQESEIRLELELQKLDAEHRSTGQLRAVAQDSLDKQHALLEELKAKPLHRAVERSVDLAFVPYSQLEGVKPGVSVIACDFGVFRCRKVGQVTEVLSGEVVAEGATRELNRGVYVVLELEESAAIKERLLRLRKS